MSRKPELTLLSFSLNSNENGLWVLEMVRIIRSNERSEDSYVDLADFLLVFFPRKSL